VMDNLPRTGICDQALLELNFKSLMEGRWHVYSAN
jgi:hypothetical protein